MNPERKKQRANFNDEIRQRIDLVAAEYGIPEPEVKKTRGRLKHYDLLCFAEKYGVALDWLICGDWKSLARMIVARRT
jgi:hypothetical protein